MTKLSAYFGVESGGFKQGRKQEYGGKCCQRPRRLALDARVNSKLEHRLVPFPANEPRVVGVQAVDAEAPDRAHRMRFLSPRGSFSIRHVSVYGSRTDAKSASPLGQPRATWREMQLVWQDSPSPRLPAWHFRSQDDAAKPGGSRPAFRPSPHFSRAPDPRIVPPTPTAAALAPYRPHL